MAVYRVEKTHDYTVMANHHLRDERLSLKAKGLLSMLLSLPDDWEISIRGLASIVTDGVGAVQTGINELIEAGYIVRRRQHAETGAFAGFEYIIHEVPPCTENPYTANPYTGKPYTENPAQSSKDKLSTISPIVPHEGDVGDESAARPLTAPFAQGSLRARKRRSGSAEPRRARLTIDRTRLPGSGRLILAERISKARSPRGTSSSPTTRRFRP